MQIQKNVQLQTFNTLKISSVASHYVNITSKDEIPVALEYAKENALNWIILSGGSNVLLPSEVCALVMHIGIKKIAVTEETDHEVFVNVGAGQNWHDFVEYSTKQGWYGLQNLALIPGRVGASPVQNIGAYGVEVGEFISCVHVYDCKSQKFTVISAKECQFQYRHSIFKENSSRYIIVSVVFCLHKKAQLRLAYGDLICAVGDQKTPENLQRQVIKIRQEKLPDPKEYPNVGSFFKNPLVSQEKYQELQQRFLKLPAYPQQNGTVKIAAGWLIDQAGWKGKRLNQVGMFEKQALVLVNYQDANLCDVQQTYFAVQADVKNMFDIQLEPEPVLFNEIGKICSHTD